MSFKEIGAALALGRAFALTPKAYGVTAEGHNFEVQEDGLVVVHDQDGKFIATFRVGMAIVQDGKPLPVKEVYHENILIGDQLQGKTGAWYPVTDVSFTRHGDVRITLDVNGTPQTVRRDAYLKSKVKRSVDGQAADRLLNEFPGSTVLHPIEGDPS